MALRDRYGIWHYRFEQGGREYSGSTGLPATEECHGAAVAIEMQNRAYIAAREEANRHRAGLTPMLYSEASRIWLEVAKGTYREHRNSWKRLKTSNAALTAAFGKSLVYSITPTDLELFTARRFEQGRKAVTIRNDLHALSVFFQFAEREHWCYGNPVREIKLPSGGSAVRMRILSHEEERRYFEAARSSPKLHDYARLMLLTGMRNTEVLQLRVRDWNADGPCIRIEKGKTRAARRLLRLVPEAAAIVERRASGRAPDAFLFPGQRPTSPATKMNNPHVRACSRAGFRFRLYDLRHTFASRAAAKGMPLTTLAAILGHAGLRCVLNYVHPGQSDMDEAMLRFGAA
jgi:integrase